LIRIEMRLRARYRLELRRSTGCKGTNTHDDRPNHETFLITCLSERNTEISYA
jgi:hypothetical protein